MFNPRIPLIALAVAVGTIAPAAALANDGDVRRDGTCSANSLREDQAQPGERPDRDRVRGRPEPQRRDLERRAPPQRQGSREDNGHDAAPKRVVRGPTDARKWPRP
jgi:hypothetical protein